MNLLAQGEPLTDPSVTVTSDTLNALNPLVVAGSQHAEALSTPSGIISRALSYIFPIAGLILFVMIVWGGFEMIMKAPTSMKMDEGRKRITYAIIGYIILFVSFWIMRILEMIFGVTLVSF